LIEQKSEVEKRVQVDMTAKNNHGYMQNSDCEKFNQYFAYLAVSTDCEALLRKFLALNPAKRYTLEQIMRDKWMNMNEDELKPYAEPSVEMSDTKIMEQLLGLGYKLNDIEKSLTNRRFDEVFGTYALLQNGGGSSSSRKLSRSKPESMTSITSAPASTAPSINSVPSSTLQQQVQQQHQKSETTTNGDGLKETSFMTMHHDDISTAKHTNDPPSPELATNFKRQHTIGPESLKERNAIRLHTVSGVSRPISATPKVAGERNLQKSPVKPLRAFKPESSLSTTAQTPRRPNVNVYKKVENNKDTPLLAPASTAAAAANTSSSTSSAAAFTRNGPSRYTFHSGQSRLQPREHSTLGSKVDPPSFAKGGNFLQRLTTRFSKRFRLNGKHPAAAAAAAATTNNTDSSNSK
jgi:MAP/microtubule affinity-regulating kinase